MVQRLEKYNRYIVEHGATKHKTYPTGQIALNPAVKHCCVAHFHLLSESTNFFFSSKLTLFGIKRIIELKGDQIYYSCPAREI